MPKNIAKNNKEKKNNWETISLKDYQHAAAQMVHFSAKTINSNTPAFGIRLASDYKLDLPYIAVSTLDRKDIPLDHIISAGFVKPPKQINAVRHNKLNNYKFSSDELKAEQVKTIESCNTLLDVHYESSDNSIGIRLRQIILQDVDGQDIAVTPLACAGFSSLINNRIAEEYERENPRDEPNNLNSKRSNKKNYISRKRAYLEVGGANAQNVGLNVRDMWKPLVFEVPTLSSQSRQIKQALAAYYNGVSFKINKNLFARFSNWQQKIMSVHFDNMPDDLRTQKQLTEFLRDITLNILKHARKLQLLLQEHREKLPGQKLCSPGLPLYQQGLLDPAERTMEWRRELANKLHSEIINTCIWVNQHQTTLKINKSETLHWISIIEDILP